MTICNLSFQTIFLALIRYHELLFILITVGDATKLTLSATNTLVRLIMTGNIVAGKNNGG